MTPKEQAALAVSLGLTVERGKKHLKVTKPSGELVAVIPPRQKRDKGNHQKNLVACLRRAGREIASA